MSSSENSSLNKLILGTLVVWRITHLLNSEDGPGDMVVRIRIFAGFGFWGRLLDCFYCLSVWVSAPIAFLLGKEFSHRSLLWPALSAGAILLNHLIYQGPSNSPESYHEESEDDYAMLW